MMECSTPTGKPVYQGQVLAGDVIRVEFTENQGLGLLAALGSSPPRAKGKRSPPEFLCSQVGEVVLTQEKMYLTRACFFGAYPHTTSSKNHLWL